MRPVFKKEDFELCHVPVPKGYPQSQTHSGVALRNGDFFLVTSPFPNILYPQRKAMVRAAIRKTSFGLFCKWIEGEKFENPLLYRGIVNGSKPATVFSLMQDGPLMETPEPYYGLPAFNSDPDVYIEDSRIYVFNRAIYRTKICPGELLNRYVIRLYLISGFIDGDRFKFERNILFKETDHDLMISPCLSKYNGEYYLTRLETSSYLDGHTFDGIYLQTSSSIDGLMAQTEWRKVKIASDDFLPWHMSLFSYRGRLYTIIACVRKGEKQRCWQMLGEFSRDLSQLCIFRTPLTDYKSYRGAAVVRGDGEFILYSTTVHEKIKGGKSVDGREVIMAHCPMEYLLTCLKNNEK